MLKISLLHSDYCQEAWNGRREASSLIFSLHYRIDELTFSCNSPFPTPLRQPKHPSCDLTTSLPAQAVEATQRTYVRAAPIPSTPSRHLIPSVPASQDRKSRAPVPSQLRAACPPSGQPEIFANRIQGEQTGIASRRPLK